MASFAAKDFQLVLVYLVGCTVEKQEWVCKINEKQTRFSSNQILDNVTCILTFIHTK